MSEWAHLIRDLSHGPTIMLAVDSPAGFGWTYVDGATGEDASIEITRSDHLGVEVTSPEEADALIEAIRTARRRVWGDAAAVERALKTHGRNAAGQTSEGAS